MRKKTGEARNLRIRRLMEDRMDCPRKSRLVRTADIRKKEDRKHKRQKDSQKKEEEDRKLEEKI